MKTHARSVAYWRLIPQQIEISENTARKVLEHSAVQPSYDGLFGTSNVYNSKRTRPHIMNNKSAGAAGTSSAASRATL